MSMVKRCASSHCCATCEYWGGPREVDRAPRWVQIPDSNVKGTCRGPGPWRGQETRNASTCPRYEEWRYL